jgi:hypothetical protein
MPATASPATCSAAWSPLDERRPRAGPGSRAASGAGPAAGATWRPTRWSARPTSIVVPTPGTRLRGAVTRGARTSPWPRSTSSSEGGGGRANRSGRPYKRALRDVRGILEYHVASGRRSADARRAAGARQALVDRLGADGLSESRIRSVVSALRALYGYAIERGNVEFNPADALVMPRADGSARSGEHDAPWADERRRVPMGATSSWSDRLDDIWHDQPRWEDRPAREGRSTAQGSERWPPKERSRAARRRRRKRDRDRDDYAPIALFSESRRLPGWGTVLRPDRPRPPSSRSALSRHAGAARPTIERTPHARVHRGARSAPARRPTRRPWHEGRRYRHVWRRLRPCRSGRGPRRGGAHVARRAVRLSGSDPAPLGMLVFGGAVMAPRSPRPRRQPSSTPLPESQWRAWHSSPSCRSS